MALQLPPTPRPKRPPRQCQCHYQHLLQPCRLYPPHLHLPRLYPLQPLRQPPQQRLRLRQRQVPAKPLSLPLPQLPQAKAWPPTSNWLSPIHPPPLARASRRLKLHRPKSQHLPKLHLR